MLAVSALRSTKDENQGEMESFSIGANDFPDFSDGNLLDSIDFDDLFVDQINDGDVLPDLEMDPELLAELSVSGGEESDMYTSMSVEKLDDNYNTKKEEEDKVSGSGSGSGSGSSRGEEIVSKSDESVVVKPPTKEADKGRKSSSHSKHSHGKRKMKKYRSHRKHLLAREAEAASWSQRRQMYGAATGGGGCKREMSPWLAPTMGFPPPITPMHHFRPLHVWGHPPMDQTLMPMWPKHLAHSPPLPPPLPPTWVPAPPPPAPDPSYWHSHNQRVPNALTPGTPCFPQPLATTRFATPPVPGIPPHAMYKVDPAGIGVPTTAQSGPHPLLDFHPTKESVDAAIGDVLSKPWQPLPLGLKPPSLDGVLGELQRQGIRKIPPSYA
ncbi:transcription activator GLK1-like isoform X2 [Corylus avellana]|uniref:transcription activator GLK1-like isoform X2 n=1 Tax=Corylus avellana TaxID=13451 RepID=UPI00286A9A3D|nr:transcription activator GLK1-like isoform X2 [Corylus avellana]